MVTFTLRQRFWISQLALVFGIGMFFGMGLEEATLTAITPSLQQQQSYMCLGGVCYVIPSILFWIAPIALLCALDILVIHTFRKKTALF